MEYKVDIVMCIDVTSSMQNCIDTVKARALKFWPDLHQALKAASKNITNVRVKVIGFRNFDVDKANALEISRYFNLSDQSGFDQKEFKAFVTNLVTAGGGDGPKNSLEALSLAIHSDWVQCQKCRHIIVLFTDASALKLEDTNRMNPYYPSNMPESLDALTNLWVAPSSAQGGGTIKLKNAAKRLIVLAPQLYPWSDIYENWDQVIYHPSTAGGELDDFDWETIMFDLADYDI